MAYANPEDQRACAKRHYQRNRASIISRAAANKRGAIKAAQAAILDYLKCHPCVDCGEEDPVVLEFDHRGRKKFNIGAVSRNGFSVKTVVAEMKVCDVRCANCHRKKTYRERGLKHRD